MGIDRQKYVKMQPNFDGEISIADKFYFGLANELEQLVVTTRYSKRFGSELCNEVVLAAVGYYQDIIADSGIWRTFCTLHNELYGKLLPFYEIDEDYIESELNLTDLKFLVWYVTECSVEANGTISPYDDDISEIAGVIYAKLEEYYDFAPVNESYNLLDEVDIYDSDHLQQVFDYSYWLFWNSYFMRYAAAPAFADTLERGQEIVARFPNPDDARPHLQELNNSAMSEYPTGPLALYVREWLVAIAENKSPFAVGRRNRKQEVEPHKYYVRFMAENGNSPIRFIYDYVDLNKFLNEKMGWGVPGEAGFFPHLAGLRNFTLYVTPERGMLIAPETAMFINHPDNVLYDATMAKAEAYTLLTLPGRCPIDLVKYVFSHNLVPDAVMPWDITGNAVKENWDFMARLYLQGFYRAE